MRAAFLFLPAFLALAACGEGAPRSALGARPATPTSAERGAPSADGVSVDDLDAAWRDQHGDTVRFAEMKVPVRVLAMAYTNCTATCPLIVADLKKVEASVPAQRRDDVQFVIVSLDPERDTPGRLAEWARETKIDGAHWTLLSGDNGAVRELAATIGVRYQSLPGNEIGHTNGLTVLDAMGRVAYQQQGLGAAAQETAATVRMLLEAR